MATRRQLQIGELIKRNFSVILQQEGSYVYGSEILVSVTHALVSPDGGLAKVYVSIYNTNDKEAVLEAIRSNMPRLKQQFSQRIRKQVRRIPNLDIYIDETLDEIDRVNSLFDDIKTDDDRRSKNWRK